MNRLLKSMMAIACAAVAVFGAAGCRNESAYELAVKNGFVGTEQEWLRSLQGADGADGGDLTAKDLYETAVENGYEGTYIEFCKDVLKVDVKEDNDIDTIAKNMTSVVSVYCGFGKTVATGGFGWGGNRTQTEYYCTAGSGVIVDLNKEAGNALVVTNYHVIYDSESNSGISDSIWLYLYGAYNGFGTKEDGSYGETTGDGICASFVGGSADYDIALLRISGCEYLQESLASKVTFADSDDVQVGEKVFAVGNPEGEGISVTQGIISVESEYITLNSSEDTSSTVDYRVIRTDAAINSGNSGGALFDTEGELIGITNAKNASSDVDNMGYALPSTQVKRLCENILRNEELYNDGSIRVARLGITVQITSSSAYYDDNGKLKIREVFSVVEVGNGSAAKAAGLAVGDRITAVKIKEEEWFTLTRQYQLIDSLLSVSMNDTIQLQYYDSNGNEKTTSVVFDKSTYFTKFS